MNVDNDCGQLAMSGFLPIFGQELPIMQMVSLQNLLHIVIHVNLSLCHCDLLHAAS